MSRVLTLPAFAFLLATLWSVPALAQSQLESRINRMEQDLNLLQREVYRGNVPAGSAAATGGTDSSNAQMEVRFTEMEERFRRIQGQLEELEFANRKLRESLERLQKDIELRFADIKSGGAVTPAVSPSQSDEKKPASVSEESDIPAEAADTTRPLKLPEKTADGSKKFETPRDHYNHAFRLLNQTQFDEAGKAFEEFIATYPKDPLIGNAFYWAGETHYVRQKYLEAADYFRQGFEAMPEGPKAGDNLLKLAMSLAYLERKDEACIVLKQVIAKFGNNSAATKKKAEQERSRLGCK